MHVLKFGGSSVADAANIKKVIEIVKDAVNRDRTVVVSSAVSGCTDSLIAIGELAKNGDGSYISLMDNLREKHHKIIEELFDNRYERKEITATCDSLFCTLSEICKGVFLLKELTPYSLDHIMSFGELLSTKIISAKLKQLNISHKWKDARELILTDRLNDKHVVNERITSAQTATFFNDDTADLYIVPGFIASDVYGRTVTLGRGGSDYTASILAAGTGARALEIWTDVCGMMTADPRIVEDATPIRNISYKEALELSHFGAKVVYPPTIQPVVKQRIPIYVKNTFYPNDAGTLIEADPPHGKNKIRGISSTDNIALLSMEGSGMVGIPGYSSRLFDILAKNNINIILITQASSVHTMCIAIPQADADRAKTAADELFAYEISLGKVDPLRIEKGFSIISLVGDDMKNQAGASGHMFEALGREGICIRAIAQGSSEKNVSAVVATTYANDAIRAIHNEFFSDCHRKMNLYICGFGGVGKALAVMIYNNAYKLKERYKVELCIRAVANSKGYVKDPLNYNELQQNISDFQKLAKGDFIEYVATRSLGNAVFVDCTANRDISGRYIELFKHKVSVVACNKIANSLSSEYFRQLADVALNEGVNYKYETTVGAALPVLSTIRQIIDSGDSIVSIEGILSGTLNYLYSRYNGQVPFGRLVRDAVKEGYAEPDPRIDLGGTDVLRKFLIMCRCANMYIERADIDFSTPLPQQLIDIESSPNFSSCSAEFYSMLERYEETIKDIYDKATGNGKRLRYTAEYSKGRYSIALREYPAVHPFYNVDETDNCIIIKTDLYPNGIVIKGAGAGTRATAQGLLHDIMIID